MPSRSSSSYSSRRRRRGRIATRQRKRYGEPSWFSGRMVRNDYFRSKNLAYYGEMGREYKYVDYSNYNVSPAYSLTMDGCFIDPYRLVGGSPIFFGIQQGNTAQTRIGNRCSITSFQIEVILSTDANTQQLPDVHNNSFFVALVLDKQHNGATPASSTVYSNPSGVAQLQVTPLRNITYSSRFKVWKAKHLKPTPINSGYIRSQDPAPPNTTYVAHAVLPATELRFTFYKKFKKPYVVRYLTTGDTQGSVENFCPHLFVNAANSTNDWKVSFQARVRFLDS